MYFSSQELHSYATNNTNSRAADHLYDLALKSGECDGIGRHDVKYTPELCDAMTRVLHERVAEGWFMEWKSFRPWVVVDVTAKLDPTKAWIGWEIETGWLSHDDRRNAITLMQERYEYSCTDQEGFGAYQVELTFSPRTPEAYEGRGTPAHPLLFVAGLDGEQQHEAYDQVGTHVNVSTPAFRVLDGAACERVASALNYGLKGMTGKDKEVLFGRENLYGGFFVQPYVGYEEVIEAGTTRWLEGKLFNSTYDKEQAREYIKTGNRIAELVELVCAVVVDKDKHFGITNMAAFLQYRTDTPQFVTGVGYVEGAAVNYGDDDDDDDERCTCSQCVNDDDDDDGGDGSW